MTKTEIEDAVSRGTTDQGRVICLYFDENFALVKWPGGSHWDGMGGNSNYPPWVKRYEMDKPLRHGAGRTVWDSAKDKDGRLTAKRIALLIVREQQA